MEKFNWWPGPLNTWSADARLPASLTAFAAPNPGRFATALVSVWSEPPYGVVGIDTGTMASYARPYQPVHYFVPYPELLELSLPKAKKEPYFHFLRDAKARGAMLAIQPGEPRSLLAESKTDGFFHALLIDTYKGSVETIWEELLTKEGMELCLKKLAPGGVLCYHISSRYYLLAPVIADVAESLGCVCRLGHDVARSKETAGMEHASSEWIMVARDEKDLAHLVAPAGYRDPFRKLPYWDTPPQTGEHVWTDASRSLAGLFSSDPIIFNLQFGMGLNRLKHYPGIPRSEAAFFVAHEPWTLFERFIVANRNKR